MKTDFIIIGGGIAGLSAANRLAEAHANVTLLESGTYPSHKICGEFLSPEAIPLLEKWGIPIATTIDTLQLNTPKKQWCYSLPKEAATTYRYELDQKLADRAEQQGAQIRTSTEVVKITAPTQRHSNYLITLKSGETLETANLLISSGRLLSLLTEQRRPTFHYVGVKAHFTGINIPNKLVMHLAENSYFGIAPIGANKVNVAGIIACHHSEALQHQKTLTTFLEKPTPLTEMLSQGTPLFEKWLSAPIPQFGIRHHPQWENCYFLGDAAGSIPPATGNGLAMALTSGILAATYALENRAEAYQKTWTRLYRSRIKYGILLQKLFLSRTFSPVIPRLATAFPSLATYLFKKTRG